MKKSDRQNLIKQLINQHEIETQDDLILFLEEAGVKTTQATISRDIREMSIIKTHSPAGKLKYTIFVQSDTSDEEKLNEAIQDSVLKVQRVEFMNIVTTTLGNADVVAALLDELEFSEIAGTIAGADNIFVISPSVEAAEVVRQRIAEYIV